MKIFKKTKIIFIALLALFFVFPVFAQVNLDPGLGATLGLVTDDVESIVIKIVNVVLGFLAIIAITFILYGGFKWMTSGGAPERVNDAKKILTSALIGLAIVLLSFAIVQFIIVDMFGGGPPTVCDAGSVGTCSGCQRCADLGDGLYNWIPDNTCLGCAGFAFNFNVTAIVPTNSSCSAGLPNEVNPRNSVIRIYFNKTVDPSSVDADSIEIQDTNPQCGVPNSDVSGTFTTTGKVVEFIPDSDCPANPCGATKCFDADSTISVKVMTSDPNRVRSMSGDDLKDNLSVDEDIKFFTNDTVDCEDPVVSLDSDPQMCLNTVNNLVASSMDDSGVAQVVFSDNNGDAAFITQTTISCPGPGICGQNPALWAGTVQWQPKVSGGYLAGNTYTITSTATDLDSNTASDSRSFTLREAHCCNGIQDPDEDGVDCGGADCAGCSGTACGNDMSTDCDGNPNSNCSDNNDRCASNICSCYNGQPDCVAAGYDAGIDDCCLCESPPIIDCITPSDASDTTGCLKPVGTEGTLVSIWGRNFGAYDPVLSTVTINSIYADLASSINNLCVNSWTNTQIVVVVPSGNVNDGAITVNSASGYSDSTDDTNGVAIDNFIDDGSNRPSLCKVENIEPASSCFNNNCGYFEESISGLGIGISNDDIVEFGNGVNYFSGISNTPNPNLEIETQVPNIIPGSVGFRVKNTNTNIYSNSLNFNITTVPGGPRIDYLDPTSGPEGQYVTIYGDNFSNSPAGNSVTFDGANGNFSFPIECDVSDYWRDNYIIVKVPSGLSVGANNVIVTVGGIPSNAVSFNVCTLNTTTCPLRPGMCKMAPVMGPVNTTQVDIWGEYFKTYDAINSRVKFFNNKLVDPGSSNWSDGEIKETNVHANAETGPVSVQDKHVVTGNSIPFEVGTCTTNGECPNPTTEVCCAGACYFGSCPTPNYSTYTWTFTTGDYFIEEECDPSNPPASPSPWSSRGGGQDVCINAAISAKFTEDILESTVIPANVSIEECTGPASNPCSTVSAVSGSLDLIDDDPSVSGVNGFIFNPTYPLSQNRWYKVTLSGGNIISVGGIPLVDDYIWTFKTRDSGDWCQVDGVSVIPNPAKLVDINSTQNFIALPKTQEDPCIVLNAPLYDWGWASTDMSVATISTNDVDGNGQIDPNQTATPVSSGDTNIQATVLQDNVMGEALLTVDFDGLAITSNWYECDGVCINAQLGARFDREVDSATLTTGGGNNVNVYSCGTDQSCSNYLANIITLNPISYIWDTVTGISEAAFYPGNDYNPDEYYKVVLSGGANGIKGVLGSQLITLNSDLAYGEECEPALSADCDTTTCLWENNACGTDHQECVNSAPGSSLDGCNDNCYNFGSVTSTCGNGIIDAGESCDYSGMCRDASGDVIGDGTQANPHEFCRVDVDCTGGTCDTVSDNGCNSSCLLTGATNTAVCGDGKIGWGEACDDNNQTNGDGCSSDCLNEGTTVAICGNGIIETGEDCDDGSTTNNDGCSSNCLSEGVLGSVCGDGVVGIGEDCDGQKGCTATCLWGGSDGEAVCGNGIVEGVEKDSYSWVFKTRPNSNPCVAKTVDVIPENRTAVVAELIPYKAVPRSGPDSCDPRGQMLNPTDYDWQWSSNDVTVATVTTSDIEPPTPLIDPNQEVKAIGVGTTQINAQAGVGGATGSGDIEVVEAAPPGTPCIITGSSCCNTGVSSCWAQGYECITDNSDCAADPPPSPFNSTNNCRCCCDPLDATEDCPGNLTCMANKGDCTGSNRGMCCGCENDGDCGAGAFCGSDTCCYPDPTVSGNEPTDNDVCLNTIVRATFDQKMDLGSFRNSIEIITDYNLLTVCPDGTRTAVLGGGGMTTPCAINGKVKSDIDGNNSVIQFFPNENLDINRTYNVVINGDANITATCGNRALDTGEDCDDGNIIGGDGCSSNCLNEGTDSPICGNNTVEIGEDCDDGDTVDNNGCSSNCLNEGTILPAICGNDDIETGEDCDDGNIIGGDGCSSDCLNEGTTPSGVKNEWNIDMQGDHSWLFTTGVDVCDIDRIKLTVEVGDGSGGKIPYEDVSSDIFTCADRNDCKRDALPSIVVDTGEDCDDGNQADGDGCSSDCLNEGTTPCVLPTDPNCCGNGYIDTGEDCDSTTNCDTSTCLNEGTDSPICGNNTVDTGEDCDDGDTDDGDGCSSTCLNEGGTSCASPTDTNCCGNGNPAGNQHIFKVYAIDSDTENILNPNDFNWTWDEKDSFNVFELNEDEAFDPQIETRSEVTSNNKNGDGHINISAVGLTPEFGSATKRADIKVFICNNPWPSIDLWPWEDNVSNNSLAGCDDGGATCDNTYFTTHYCRDAGGPGYEDDLPQIAINPITFSDADDIDKEMIFINDTSGTGGPIIFDAFVENTTNAAAACEGVNGDIFNIKAKIVDLDGVDTASVVAYIKTSLFESYSDVVLGSRNILLVNGDPVGDNLYEGQWTSSCAAGDCQYFVDIVASDLLGYESVLENIRCGQ